MRGYEGQDSLAVYSLISTKVACTFNCGASVLLFMVTEFDCIAEVPCNFVHCQ